MARLGRAQAFGPIQFGTIAPGVDVTVALSGQAITCSLGTLVAAATIAITGAAVTASAGTIVSARTRALSGSAVSLSQGTIRVEGVSANIRPYRGLRAKGVRNYW
jgi:hypothetical protein